MKTLRFADGLPELVLTGKKTVTWRINDEKNISVGDIVSFLRINGEKFAKTRVINVKETTFGALTEDDWRGHEKYASEEEMYRHYSKLYGFEVTPKTNLKIIRFRLLA